MWAADETWVKSDPRSALSTQAVENSNLKKNSGLNGIRTYDFAIPVQYFIHWATKPHG